MSTMTRLYRKDWRVYRAAVIGGAVVLLIPYALAALALVSDGRGSHPVTSVLIRAALMGLWLTVVTAAAFGGAAFAAERRDRSGEFLAMVPVSRARIIRSKVWAGLTCLLALWGVNALVLVAARARQLLDNGYALPDDPVLNGLWNNTSIAIMAFGVAWFVSSVISSPAIATSCSVAITVLTLVVTIDWASHQLWSSDVGSDVSSAIEFAIGSRRTALMEGRATFSAQGVARLVMWVLGVLAWGAGTAVFIRRVSP